MRRSIFRNFILLIGLHYTNLIFSQDTCNISNLWVNGNFEDTNMLCYELTPFNKYSNNQAPWYGYTMMRWQPSYVLQPSYLDEADHDHTTGTKNGHYLYIDPRDQSMYGEQFCQNFQVEPFKDYSFSLWYTSMNKYSKQEAIIRLTVNGVSIDSDLVISNIPNTWKPLNAKWNASVNKIARACLETKNARVDGNDFAIDDIVFGPGRMVADAGKDTLICVNGNLNLGGAGSSLSGSSCGVFRYQWEPASHIDGANNIEHPKLKSPIVYGYYNVTVMDLNHNFCRDSVWIGPANDKKTFLRISDSVFCDSVIIRVDDSIKGFVWDDGSFTRNRKIDKSGKFWIRYTSECQYKFDTFYMEKFDNTDSMISFSANLCGEYPIKLTVNNEGAISWNDGDTSHERIVNEPGIYFFNGSNKCGIVSDTFHLNSFGLGLKNLKIPNVFTPNDDGYNNCYNIDGFDPNCYEADIWIYNRWGILVFEGVLPNECWNGKLKNVGGELSSGVYYYLIFPKPKGSNLKTNCLKICGVIHLIR